MEFSKPDHEETKEERLARWQARREWADKEKAKRGEETARIVKLREDELSKRWADSELNKARAEEDQT